VLFNEGVLLAKSLFIVALYACPSSGYAELGRIKILFESLEAYDQIFD